jgi:hypothetical protein
LPTRFRFNDLAADRLPHSAHSRLMKLDAAGEMEPDFINAVVDRWREATTTSQRPRTNMLGRDPDGIPADDYDDGLGAPLIPRRSGG